MVCCSPCSRVWVGLNPVSFSILVLSQQSLNTSESLGRIRWASVMNATSDAISPFTISRVLCHRDLTAGSDIHHFTNGLVGFGQGNKTRHRYQGHSLKSRVGERSPNRILFLAVLQFGPMMVGMTALALCLGP